MNASRMLINLAKRSYGAQKSWKVRPNPGIQRRADMLEDDIEKDLESFNEFDLEDAEPDFSQAHKSYSMHKQEMAEAKEKLKLRIVARKYFKEHEPNLLTYIEKQQIRHLHESDSLVYTPEKLSESFPALPHTIRKIIKVRWHARNADRVLKHDQQVINNWQKFKRGELPLEPRIRQHLEKFKNRKITLPDKAEVEQKLLPPPPEFKKPQSQLYTGIIQNYLKEKKGHDENNEVVCLSGSDEVDNGSENNYESKDLMHEYSKNSVENNLTFNPNQNHHVISLRDTKSLKTRIRNSDKPLTLDKFFEESVKNMGTIPSLEDKVLMDTYKKKVELETMKNQKMESVDRSSLQNFSASAESKLPMAAVERRNEAKNVEVPDDSKEMGLQTYVKVWEKKVIRDEHYSEVIKIPKDKYKKGKLYKIRDCFYDDDGEFLYRVPGLKG
ncbi:uncharacterized protein LOC124305660 [Neodiprion virginianus]|uniref:uncharacterized protein LOC124305660 n=1 Tax=Neodiprion virginianus TaxID=2961670 RepID=UPI001EE70038|nr:uncharacterized protein LOC124305660 [Neodiprion virginianus]